MILGSSYQPDLILRQLLNMGGTVEFGWGHDGPRGIATVVAPESSGNPLTRTKYM